ncbi:hypothetical protein SAMN06265365_10887 [Tistlia consotensis]|uniref:Uncharacterized protein n=1 Tax=Tistlia consotensis USBA 355 TaxID=560819 RepID=A0A1Y6BQV2_9PROT|nr:hypothetical protein SAMN05428998_10893 [Tistlia consotensis USBA 355]SNR60509.1 hypothetical protein SAMN06265365_10887 [Tistlia consotensis]
MVITLKSKADSASPRRERSNLIFRRGGKLEYIRSGDTFRHKNGGPVEELARIISIYADSNNIPHVRFELSLRRNELGVPGGPRILALNSFRERFRERVR